MVLTAVTGTPELAAHYSALGAPFRASAQYAHLTIGDDIRARCRTTVDLMAELHDIPAAVITRLHENHLEVVAASTAEEHPFKAGLVANLDAGTCCEAVIAGNAVLLVPNARIDPVWRSAPTLAAGFTAYLGMPILWPNGDVFGTIALLDRKANPFSDAAVRLLRKFKETVEADVELLVRLDERDRTDRELKTAKESAEAASRAKSMFLANMSHELRTPLNSVLGFTQLLTRDGGLSQLQLERMLIIERSSRHLLAQIDEVLEMSRVESGATSLRDEAIEPRALLGEVREMFLVQCADKGLTLGVSAAADLPRAFRGDPVKLGRVLVNLVGNAIKFTERGGVELRARPEGETLALEVEDTGPGIDGADLDAIFEPFARADGGGGGDGTGLGLSITRELVSLMGGRVEVDSEPGRGSVFRVVLPLRRGADLEPPDAGGARRVTRLVPTAPAPRVLVVEDRSENRRLLEEILSPLGFDVTAAGSGAACLERFAARPFDVVLMDIRMPGMDGYEAARRVRTLPGGAGATIVAVTASTFRDEEERVLAAGCDAMIRKPFDQDELLTLLAERRGLVYERAEVQAPPPRPRGLSHADLAALGDERLSALGAAAVAADADAIARLLDDREAGHPRLCAGLRELVGAFRFDVIAALAREARRSPDASV